MPLPVFAPSRGGVDAEEDSESIENLPGHAGTPAGLFSLYQLPRLAMDYEPRLETPVSEDDFPDDDYYDDSNADDEF